TSGEVVYEKNRIAVQTSHTIQGDVDMKIGNIKFPGTITIGGTVRSGFYVVSGGDIRIAGGVEGALLSADGDILIKQGVKGAGKAVLRSKRNIMSTFVELATVLSVGDVTLTSSIVRSRIKCNGKITFQGEKGRIIGGQIRARNGLHVLSVGSPRGIKTHVSFGQDYLIADLIEKEEKEIEKVKRRITQVDISMRKLEKEGSRNEALQKLRKEKVQLLKLMEKRGLRLFTLRERFEQHYPSRIVVTGEVHTGTVFESHGRTYEITTPRKGIAVEFNSETGNIDVNELERENKE
ncbi:MAG: FapA family protein, partial [Alkalispirochaeta sp.]